VSDNKPVEAKHVADGYVALRVVFDGIINSIPDTLVLFF
jgi:hypothetical protein